MKMNELVVMLQKDYSSIVRAMKLCNHHNEIKGDINPYHQESDVFTHVMMVCKQAENQSYPVRLAALLHDIGKPVTRGYNEKGYVTFYNHEPVSAFLALEIMKDLNLDHKTRRLVFEAIAIHTEVFKLTPDKLAERMVNNEDLYNVVFELGKADHEGRFTDDPVPLVRMQPKTVPNELKYNELVMLVGLPCSGKSTHLGKLYSNHFTVSRDDIVMQLSEGLDYNAAFKKVDQSKVDALLEQRLKEAETQSNVVIDMTNMTRKGRAKILRRFPNHNRIAEVMMPTMIEILDRNEARKDKQIPNNVLDDMVKRFYPPLYDEFDVINYRF